MNDKIVRSLILLTYKGKILLMYKSNSSVDQEKHLWSFIGVAKVKGESFEEALARRVEKETGIKIGDVEFVSDSCYHSELSDDNVNQMQRAEFQSLDFFSLKDIKKLSLSQATEQFLSKHYGVM